MVATGNWLLWLMVSGAAAVRIVAIAVSGTSAPLLVATIDVLDRLRAAPELRRHLEHHPVLVRLREDGRDQPLAEGVVERGVDRRRRHAEPPGGVAVDLDECLQALHQVVAGHVGELRQRLHPLDHLRHPLVQALRVRRLERVLVLRARDPVLDGQVLHRLQVQPRPGTFSSDACSRRMISGARASRSRERLELDQHAAGVGRGVLAVDADEGRQALAPPGPPAPRAPAPAGARPWPGTKRSAAPRRCPG